MKISSVSKKVLSGALSAAMVVAFAPVTAFAADAATGTVVKVNYDMGAGKQATGYQEIVASADQQIDGSVDGKLAINKDAWTAASTYTSGSYKFSGFYYDANNNGYYDSEDSLVSADNGAFTGIDADDAADGEITVHAIYASGIAVTENTFATDKDLTTAANFTVKLSNSNAAKKVATVELQKDGAAVASVAHEIAAKSGSTDGTETYSFTWGTAADVTAGPANIDKTAWGEGNWTILVKDAQGNVLARADKTICKVTLTGGVFGAGVTAKNSVELLAAKDTTYADLLGAASDQSDYAATDTAAKDKKEFNGYKLDGEKILSYDSSKEEFSSVPATAVKIKASSTLTAAWNVEEAGALTFSGSNLTFTVDNFDSATGEHKVTLTTPSGTVEMAETTTSGQYTYSFGSAKLAAGEYSATATVTVGKGTSAEKTTTIGTSKLELVKIQYAAGEGGKLTDAAVAANNAAGVVESTKTFGELSIGAYVEAIDPTQAFDKWVVDGKAYKSTDKIGTGSDYTVTLTATYKVAAAAAPTFTYENGYLKLVNNAGDGYTLKYGTAYGSLNATYNDAGTGIKVDPTATTIYYVQAQYKDSTKANSKVVAIVPAAKAAETYEAFADKALAQETAASKTAKIERYSDVLKDAKKAGSDALKAAAYQSKTVTAAVTDNTTGWDKAIAEQEKAVLQAIANYETTKLDELKTPVKDAKGENYVYATDEAIAEATANINKVLGAFDENTNGDVNFQKADGTPVATNPSLDAGDYAKAIAAAAKGVSKTSVKVADVEAAQAVDAQINKLAADYATVTRDNYVEAAAAAADAQTDYAALTAAQKALVTADIQTIASVIADAAEIADQVKDEETAKKLADAQDQAAANLLYSKTVTAKAKVGKKAQGKSFTYKLGASESGAVATYAKASGSKYIKVSASGKVTFSKVKAAKKAKTYKAKVTVTYGTKTCTKTVTYKVVKK